MPELPEVEVICRGLSPIITGRIIRAAAVSGKRLRLPIPQAAIDGFAINQRITAVRRRAKYLIIALANGAELIIHLGMTGKLGVFPRGILPARHDHLRLRLDNNMELRLNDARRFGSIQVLAPNIDEAFFSPP